MFSVMSVCLSTGGGPMWLLPMMHWTSPYRDSPQTCSNLFIMEHVRLASGPLASYYNAFLLWAVITICQQALLCWGMCFILLHGNLQRLFNKNNFMNHKCDAKSIDITTRKSMYNKIWLNPRPSLQIQHYCINVPIVNKDRKNHLTAFRLTHLYSSSRNLPEYFMHLLRCIITHMGFIWKRNDKN